MQRFIICTMLVFFNQVCIYPKISEVGDIDDLIRLKNVTLNISEKKKSRNKINKEVVAAIYVSILIASFVHISSSSLLIKNTLLTNFS